MAEVEELRATRKGKKSAFTKEANAIIRYIAEKKDDEVRSRSEKLKTRFSEFEEAHDKYHDLLTAEDAVDASDEFFNDVQTTYVSTLNSVNAYLALRADTKAPATRPEISKNDSDISRSELLGVLNLPKVELEIFDGDPLQYHSFFAVFDEQVDKVAVNSKMKLTRLLQCTAGKAKEAIRCCSLLEGDQGYREARLILKTRFGSDHLISDKVIKGLKYGKPVRSAMDLQKLSDDVANGYSILKQLKRVSEVDTQSSIIEIIDRLQPYVKNRWKRHVFDHKRQAGEYPDFKNFMEFLHQTAEEANDPVYGESTKSAYDSNKIIKRPAAVSSFSTDAYTRRRPPCILCSEDHKLRHCIKFKELKVTDRLKLVKDKKLCENCLLGNHSTVNCKNEHVCTVQGCGRKHSNFLHVGQPERFVHVNNANTMVDYKPNVKVGQSDIVSNTGVHMPLVSVKVNGSLKATALLDSGSSSTFCTKDLARTLGLVGHRVSYKLNTLCSENESVTSEVVKFNVSSMDGKERLHFTNVYVVDSIPVKSMPVGNLELEHLKGLQLCNSGVVQILIGQDQCEALLPLDVRRGRCNEAFAVRTLFGWVLNGPGRIPNLASRNVVNHFISTNAFIEPDINRLWHIENEGITDEEAWSVEDKKVIELWDRECVMIDGRYQIPIPWKDDVSVPNNYVMAFSRLKATERNLVRKGLFDQYDFEIKKLLEKGYAEKVPVEENLNNGKIWYLPHQAVISDKKPGKLRVVFDCAAKFDGQSLNDKCMQGPNLSNKLLDVLLRFRQDPFAIVGDIEAMYYQVVIPSVDRDALRFLWFDGDVIMQYRMTRHVFGGIWCASSSGYAMRRVVQDNADVDPMVASTIMRSFYVDDCLKSLPKKEQVEEVLMGTKELLSRGGFRLTKFVLNDKELLELIPEGDKAEEMHLIKESSCSKALGIKWDVDTDQFYFDVNLSDDGDQPLTRRRILSLVSSIYDPLGLVSPIIIKGKLILQEVTRCKLSWDEHVPEILSIKWRQWVNYLHGLRDLKVPRCIKPVEFNDAALELHHFSDASQSAYGCVSYLRSINKMGQIHVEFVVSKSKVAPLKSMTIPRLELEAAVLASKIDATLRRELDLDLGTSWFWTDSEIILRYIANESRRFQVFVGNRVSAIQNLTKTEQWHFIPGVQNPADLLTRGENVSSIDRRKWFGGPKFLHSHKATWLTQAVDCNLLRDDPEVRVHDCFVVDLVEVSDPIEELFKRHSSWYSLKRSAAWILRFKDYLRNKSMDGVCRKLTAREIHNAEISILRYVQSKKYANEVSALAAGKSVLKSSDLSSLDPILDEDGIIRLGGRLKRARALEVCIHPYLIPHDHPIAKMIVLDYHNVAHCGTEWVVSEIRKRFWITRVRSVVKSVSHACMFCRKMFASVCSQKMSDLPTERLESGNRPFTYTGVDCFGPFLVKQGRAEIKRYGCIFSCLNTRAVHLEKLNTLEADSFLNAFRRFVARRGSPKKVWSDNGTNLVGGYAEMSKSLKQLDQKVIHEYSVKNGLEWCFNPPTASHMGGAWERLIRVVRKVLVGMLKNDCRLSDEGLETLFCEVEQVVNSRPITRLSDSVLDSSPLTPNHLLLLSDNAAFPPGMFRESDLYKRRWRQVQHLANVFWKRWLREYLPELHVRSKWHHAKPNLKEGDLVLILGENTPRGLWPLGLIIEVYRSEDGLVRSAKVKTKSSQFVRPVAKLVLLEGSL